MALCSHQAPYLQTLSLPPLPARRSRHGWTHLRTMQRQFPPSFQSMPKVSLPTFRMLEYKGYSVCYMADKGLVNLTHVLNMYKAKNKLKKALHHFKSMDKVLVKGGRGQRQGTYVSFDDAHRILRHLSIKSGALQSLSEQAATHLHRTT